MPLGNHPGPGICFPAMQQVSWPFAMLHGLRKAFLQFGAAAILAAALPSLSQDKVPTIPLSEIHAGMEGVAYTIFAGDEIEKMNLKVLGVLPNAMGPGASIILVELEGPKVEHSGVVAGMSGSPVYFDGRLAGAIALKMGIFSKEAIAGVTPIENMLDVSRAEPAAKSASLALPAPMPGRVDIPASLAQTMRLSPGNFLTPIQTPLVFSGVYPETLARFADQLGAYGMAAVQGGTAAPRPDDAHIQPGDMVSMMLLKGDMSVAAGCTVTAIVGDRVFICGHPVFGFGSVEMPMVRSRTVTTLNSELESFKILTTGSVIGTVTQDRVTAVMGHLGAGPRMIPVEVSLVTPAQEKIFHFEVIDNAKLTPLLVGLAAYNGIVSNTAYSEGQTLQLSETIEIEGHAPVKVENLFAPSDTPAPDGFFLASQVQGDFARIYTNPYEPPRVQKVRLQVTSLPERRSAIIDDAWSEKSEVKPGETLGIKVMLHPYRGAPILREVSITIPPQAARGPLRVLVSDSGVLNRKAMLSAAGDQLPGLEQLIAVLNRERRNDRLYVTVLQPTPTLLVEDKEMPNAPVSEINILDHWRNPGAATLLGESTAGEWSVEMNQVISGQRYLTLTVK
jgi:hypothetical protein